MYVSIAFACPEISHHTHVRGKRFTKGTQLHVVIMFLVSFRYSSISERSNWTTWRKWTSGTSCTPISQAYQKLRQRLDLNDSCLLTERTSLFPHRLLKVKNIKPSWFCTNAQTFNFDTPEVVDDQYRKRKKCHVFLKILSRFVFYFSHARHSSDVLPRRLDERRGRIW